MESFDSIFFNLEDTDICFFRDRCEMKLLLTILMRGLIVSL